MPKTTTKKRYGWTPSLPDHRDYVYEAPHGLTTLAPSVDLRNIAPPVMDQGDLGSCTSFAIGELVQCLLKKESKSAFVPSHLFIYYQERLLENTVSSDAGAMIRDGLKVVSRYGTPHETLWPYVVNNFKKKPPKKVYDDALLHKVTAYKNLDNTNLTILKSCLASGQPFVGGISVYESFESDQVAQDGKVPMPSRHEDMLGGHAILILGYDDANQWFICQNSWGSGWGDHGFFYMPYAYLTSARLADDFWTASVVM